MNPETTPERLEQFLSLLLHTEVKILHNRGIKTKLEAWLTLFCTDEPREILQLIQTYPEFKLIYEQVYDLCINVEGVMKMFSKELQILDRNTVQLMIDEMQQTIDRQKLKIQEYERRQTEERHRYEEQLTSLTQRLAQLEQRQT